MNECQPLAAGRTPRWSARSAAYDDEELAMDGVGGFGGYEAGRCRLTLSNPR